VLGKRKSIERKMKAAIYYSPEDIRTEQVPIPEIGDDEILVQMKACGICGSDLMDWYLKTRAPLVLGHEPAGIVAKKGKKVEDFNIGERVFVHHHVACMTCHYCVNGDYTLCDTFHKTNIKPGGFAEYFKVPALNLKLDTLVIPENLPFEEATFIEPVGCCIRALNKCQLKQGDSIAIIGAGSTGLIHTALSKIYGSSMTIVSDLFDHRLNCAEKFGADITVNPKNDDLKKIVKTTTNDIGVDVVVITAPSVEAYRAGMEICRKGGKLCIFAPTSPSKSMEVSLKELFFSELQIIPSYSTSHLETRAALQLIGSGKLEVKELITQRFGLEDTAEAFKMASNSEKSLKVVILSG
jgi:L-iditol 2-dehydrogenase